MMLSRVEKIEILSSQLEPCEMLLIFVVLIGWDITSETLNVWLDFGFAEQRTLLRISHMSGSRKR